MTNLTTVISVAAASFAASFVEAVEALTIVLAVALARGWRPALTGAAAALAALALIVAILGRWSAPFRSGRCRASSARSCYVRTALAAQGDPARHRRRRPPRRGSRLSAPDARADRSRAAAGAGTGLDRRRNRVQGGATRGDRGRVHRRRVRRGARSLDWRAPAPWRRALVQRRSARRFIGRCPACRKTRSSSGSA